MRFSSVLILLFLVFTPSAADGVIDDILTHVDVLQKNVPPPTLSPTEENEQAKQLEEAMNSVLEAEPTDSGKKNIDALNKMVKEMGETADLDSKENQNKSDGVTGEWAKKTTSHLDTGKKAETPTPLVTDRLIQN